MRWYRNLYLGPNAACKIQKIRQKAAEQKLMAGVYYITPASSNGNLLDIYHNGLLCQPLFARLQNTDVLGVAEGKREALDLVQEIIQEVYQTTGGFDLKSYFPEEDFLADENA